MTIWRRWRGDEHPSGAFRTPSCSVNGGQSLEQTRRTETSEKLRRMPRASREAASHGIHLSSPQEEELGSELQDAGSEKNLEIMGSFAFPKLTRRKNLLELPFSTQKTTRNNSHIAQSDLRIEVPPHISEPSNLQAPEI